MPRLPPIVFLAGVVSASSAAPARIASPDLSWRTIDAGGGTSAGGPFSLTGTIGQHDAGPALSAGGLTLGGGFWSNLDGLPHCPADFNRDGVADFFDYLDFATAFAAEDPSADLNNDGVVDFFDYLDFVRAFDAGCG